MTVREAVATRPLPSTTDAPAGRHLEMSFFLLLLLLANLGLLIGNVPAANLMYDPAAVAAGQWWRLGTWPWVHVSRYHLLLDAGAFLLLYQGLEAPAAGRRLACLLGAAAGSLLLPLWCAPEIGRLGLCGLSGPAHGLMAVTALELRAQPRNRRLGLWLLAGLLTKTFWELGTGTVFLQQLHFGDIGTPIVTTHAGGVIGGMLVFALGKLVERGRKRSPGGIIRAITP